MRGCWSFWEWTIALDGVHTAVVRNRREIWREFMGCFEPSSDPRDAVQRGFYVPRPGRTLAEQLAARFEVKPSASHLLVGGVGSGKTTQLLIASERLRSTRDIYATYIDVSLHSDPNGMIATDLVAAIGVELIGQMPEFLKSNEIKGYLTWFFEYLALDGPAWNDDPIDIFIQRLQKIIEESRQPGDAILLIDSLDRMSDLERFSNLVDGAIPKLRQAGIGIILVGPLTALYGIRRTSMDRFDKNWHLSSVDVQDDAEGRTFLQRVLDARDKMHLLTPEAKEKLAVYSGGVMRDLIALTQAAGEEAYVDDADQVDMKHVEIAADQFGRKHLFAIDSEQLAVLQRVRKNGTFVQTSEKDLALLATRRVLEYTNGKPPFAVHPTIEPLLAQIEGVG